MKKITHLDMTAHLKAYTEKVKAEAAQAEAVRAAVRNGAPRPAPTERLRVTDLH